MTKFTKGELLSKMIVMATNAHAGTFDRAKVPYIMHPIAVMQLLKGDDAKDEELQCIALGHDMIEDTNTTYADLRNAGFTPRIIEGIRCLTKVPGETYEEYCDKVKSNVDAIKVKMADLLHNSDLTRLKGITVKDMERANRYMKLYYELAVANVHIQLKESNDD